MSYYNDHRVSGGRRAKYWKKLNINKMTMVVEIYDEANDETYEKEVPFEFEVCPTCRGRGSHVEPGIDCNGLTAEDFAEDPDFREDYFSGRYDVPCYRCNGEKVVPVIDDSEVLEHLHQMWQAQAEIEAEYAAERRFGA